MFFSTEVDQNLLKSCEVHKLNNGESIQDTRTAETFDSISCSASLNG